MTKLFLCCLCILFIGSKAFSQETPPEGAIMIDEKTIVKDSAGNQIEQAKFFELMDSGEWSINPVMDSEGKLSYLQLKKATEEEKKMMADMKGGTMGAPANQEKIGTSVPSFKMEDMNGNKLTAKNTKGKIVVLSFWFTACKPCVMEMPELNKVYETYKANPNVVFAAVTFDSKEKVNTFLKDHTLSYPIVSDAEAVCKSFGVGSYPTNMVIDGTGKISSYYNGSFPGVGEALSSSIKQALEALGK